MSTERLEESMLAEQEPPSRRPWSTPRVILSAVESAKGGAAGSTPDAAVTPGTLS